MSEEKRFAHLQAELFKILDQPQRPSILKQPRGTLVTIYQGDTPRQTVEHIFHVPGYKTEEAHENMIRFAYASQEKNPDLSKMESDQLELSRNTFASIDVNMSETKEDDEVTPDAVKEESECSSSYSSETSWPNFDIPGSWGTYGLEDDPWDDTDKPCVHFKDYDDLELFPDEEAGILSDRIIASCSSYLSKCPQTGQYVLCKCNLRNKNLSNITILMYHHYLQYVDLSGNQLTSLEALSQLPFLMYLNVSRNMLTDVLNFKAPFNLTYVNFSYNYVDIIPDLSEFWSIVYLDLSHNQVFQITGLSNLRYLRYLDLSYNQITALQNLNNMKLTHLNLQENKIETFEEGCGLGLCTLPDLIVVNLSRNLLTSLRLFEGVRILQKLIMTDNAVKCLYEIESLKQLRYLTEVYFKGNPIATEKNYYEVCINCIRPILLLDGEYISAEDKVLASSKYVPSPIIASSKNHSDLHLLEQLSTCEINNMILPFTKVPPPMIVLVGPPGSGQKTVIREFYEKHKKYLRLGVSHTTRQKNSNETEGSGYYFVSEEKFEDMVRNAEFVTVSNILGYTYGFSYEELMKYADENAVLLLHTDIVGALNLRMRNLRPYLVLTLYFQNDVYYAQLLQKYYYTYWLSRNYKALRIINDSAKINSSSSSGISSDVEEILKEIITNLPVKNPSKKSSVKFVEPILPRQMISGLTSCIYSDSEGFTDVKEPSFSDEMISLIDEAKRKDGSSFNLSDGEEVFHSISEVEFDFEPVLSVVSEHKIVEDREDSMRIQSRRMKPNQRIDAFIQSILADRKYYIDFHKENPGIFCETIFIDKMEATMNKLEQLLKQALSRSQEPWHSYKIETDPVFEEMVSEKLSDFHREMEK